MENFQRQKEQPKKQTGSFLLSNLKGEYIESAHPIKLKKYLALISSSFKQLKLSMPFPVFISEDESLIILANTPHQHLKDIFTVGFYTGLRLGELINMQWNWIDLFQNYITVKCSDGFLTKSKKERNVPMSEKVKSILINRFNLSVHQSNEIVFYRIKGRKLHQETISKQFKKIVRKSNLNDRIHFHTLRYSFASLLVQ